MNEIIVSWKRFTETHNSINNIFKDQTMKFNLEIPFLKSKWELAKNALFISTALALFNSSYANANYAHFMNISDFKNKTELKLAIENFDSNQVPINASLFTPGGEWMLISGKTTVRSEGFSNTFARSITASLQVGKRVVAGDCSEKNACVVVYSDWSSSVLNEGNVPDCFSDLITRYRDNAWRLKDVEITADSCVVLAEDGEARYSTNLDAELRNAIFDRRASGRSIDSLTIGFKKEWALVSDHNPMYSGIPQGFINVLNDRARNSTFSADMIALGSDDNYLWYSGHTDSTSTTSKIGAIEYDLLNGDSIWKRMNALKIPGVSVALIENTANGPEVVTARGYGLRRADDDLPILARTPFALASLSKYLGALTVADQVESDAGVTQTTNLFTANVLPANGQLQIWKKAGENADSDFAKNLPNTIGGNNLRATLKNITLDRLMVHTSGIVGELGGSSMVEQPEWADNNSQPTSTWLFGRSCRDGCAKYANSVWQVDTANLNFDYHSANYLVAQGYLEDRTGQDVHTNLKNRLFDRVDMPDSSSRIELNNARQKEVAWRHDGNTPQAPMKNSAWPLGGGIFSSSVDYANAMIVIMNQGVAANGTRILSANSVNDLFLNRPVGQTVSRAWGIDFGSNVASIAEGTNEPFSHGGLNDGTRTLMCGNPTKNQGIVILVNSDSDEAKTLINEIADAYLAKVDWDSEAVCR